MSLYKNITEAIGNTPIIEIEKDIFVKCEYFEPSSSIKDRAALFIINKAIKDGLLKENGKVIEATSGNTGIALAMICSSMGFEFIACMPSSASKERKDLLKLLGSTLVETDPSLGMQGSVDMAIKLNKKYENSILTNQFENYSNVQAHIETTTNEIIKDLKHVDILVAGFGTGGTLTGTSIGLKQKFKDLKVIAVEPFESPKLSQDKAGPHLIQGIGANFIPKLLDKSIIDQIITIKGLDAVNECKKVIKENGLLCGISSGANIKAARLIKKQYPGKKIITFACDTCERYLSILGEN